MCFKDSYIFPIACSLKYQGNSSVRNTISVEASCSGAGRIVSCFSIYSSVQGTCCVQHLHHGLCMGICWLAPMSIVWAFTVKPKLIGPPKKQQTIKLDLLVKRLFFTNECANPFVWFRARAPK